MRPRQAARGLAEGKEALKENAAGWISGALALTSRKTWRLQPLPDGVIPSLGLCRLVAVPCRVRDG